jgi:hypothetical protein
MTFKRMKDGIIVCLYLFADPWHPGGLIDWEVVRNEGDSQ